MQCFYHYETAIGAVTICETDGSITALQFGTIEMSGAEHETPLLHRAYIQLYEYLSSERTVFTLPLQPQGTAFQQKVWAALQEIPYGKTITYSELAAQIGNPKACRAVGMANHRNPIAILIPCHRVIGKNSSLTGYAGGLQIKERLLALEHSNQRRYI